MSFQLLSAQSQAIDEQALRDLIANYEKARDQVHEESLKGLFTQEADQLVSSGTWRRGLDTVVAGMISSSKRNSGDRSIQIETVRFLTESLAIVDARYIIKGSNGNSDRKMWSTFIAQKEKNQWRIAAIRNMLPAPPSN